jgi:soluble lytic murein transglycosylase-like protein
MAPSLHRRLLLPLAAVMLSSLSCAVMAPTTTPVVRAAPPEPATEAPIAEGAAQPDPVVDAVREYLLDYQRRTGLTRGEIADLAQTIVGEAQRCGMDPALILAVMHVESRYNAFAVSSKDAMGLMQIIPSTGQELAARLGIRWDGPHTLFDPTANVRIGVAYLQELRDRYGNLSTALAAYNWGPGRIDRRISRGAALPTIYARLVLEAYGDTGGDTARSS